MTWATVQAGLLGTAVVCWHTDGRVAVVGRVFADSAGDEVMAIAKITYYNNGVAGTPQEFSVYGNFAASTVVSQVTGAGNFTRVRIQLFNGNVTALGDGSDTLLQTINRYPVD